MTEEYTSAAVRASRPPVVRYSDSSAVGNGMAATVINSSRLRNRATRSTRPISSNTPWWLTQMMPMIRKLVTYAAYAGHCSASALASDPSSVCRAGTRRSRTSRVIAMARTPSLNVSVRLVWLIRPVSTDLLLRGFVECGAGEVAAPGGGLPVPVCALVEQFPRRGHQGVEGGERERSAHRDPADAEVGEFRDARAARRGEHV